MKTTKEQKAKQVEYAVKMMDRFLKQALECKPYSVEVSVKIGDNFFSHKFYRTLSVIEFAQKMQKQGYLWASDGEVAALKEANNPYANLEMVFIDHG